MRQAFAADDGFRRTPAAYHRLVRPPRAGAPESWLPLP